MEMSLSTIKELVTLLVDNKLERLEFEGLVLVKSKYQEKAIELASKEDPLQTLVSQVSNSVPDWIRENRHLINEAPFKEPMTFRPKE